MMGPKIIRSMLVVCAVALPLLGMAGSSRVADLKKLDEWVLLEQSFTDAVRREAQRAIAGHLPQWCIFRPLVEPAASVAYSGTASPAHAA